MSKSDGYEWYMVLKYTVDDYMGEPVDAYYVHSIEQALVIAAKGPLRPGEMLRGMWCHTEAQRKKSIKLHEQRLKETGSGNC